MREKKITKTNMSAFYEEISLWLNWTLELDLPACYSAWPPSLFCFYLVIPAYFFLCPSFLICFYYSDFCLAGLCERIFSNYSQNEGEYKQMHVSWIYNSNPWLVLGLSLLYFLSILLGIISSPIFVIPTTFKFPCMCACSCGRLHVYMCSL